MLPGGGQAKIGARAPPFGIRHKKRSSSCKNRTPPSNQDYTFHFFSFGTPSQIGSRNIETLQFFSLGWTPLTISKMIVFQSSFLLIATLASCFSAAIAEESQIDDVGYGLDCSWPIHNFESSCGDMLGDRKAVYDEYLRGCREKWGSKGAVRCTQGEADRLEMSRRQPQSMVVSLILASFFRSDEMMNRLMECYFCIELYEYRIP